MLLRVFLAAVFAIFLVPASAAAQRLPNTVSPDHYDLTFVVDLARQRFSGRTGIDVRTTQSSTQIKLHALELDITSAAIAAGGQTQQATVSLNRDEQTATLTVAKAVPAGRARIEIAYEAALNDKLRGLYLSKGATRSYAVTQLESTDARRAFPCFDEPAFKATFAVTVTADRGDIVISNGRMMSDTPGPGPAQHTMKFSTTAKMSSYLVALAIGDFQCLEGTADNVPIRICATPEKKELGHIALESAQYILPFLNRYHTMKYPFGKLDVVAVPDFAAGAMENTAAIFFRDTNLLADSKTASPAVRKTIASILAHEIAHMWFGDLVTMQWWDDLWLNESFATWMATRPVGAWKPEWHADVEEATENQTALALDSLQSTHPIHVTVNTPDEIESVFDPISYNKGAAVLRMLESYVGEEAFQRGVNAYLDKHKYANATSEDFFASIANASGKPVDRVIGTFVMQPGVPQVDVATSCAGGRSSVTLTQRRFTLDASGATPGRWQIPICLKTATATTPTCVVLTDEKQTFPLGGTCTPWVFANAGGKGYYRTAYAPESIKSLAGAVGSALSAPERLSLASDEWALVRAGRHSVADYLELASGYGREPMADVLTVITDRVGFVDDYLTTAANRPRFKRFVRDLLTPAYRELGFDSPAGEPDDRRARRAVVISALGFIGQDPDVVSRATRAVTDHLQRGTRLDPVMATTLVRIAAANGDAKLFDALAQAAAKATDPQDHYRYLYALPRFTDPALITRALERALSSELRSQDTALYLAPFFANDAARDRAWAFIKEHWSAIEPKVTVAGSDSLLVNSLAAFCSAEARDDIRAFFAAHKLPTAERSLRQALERINNCVDTKQRQAPALEAWLQR